ncbi:hypothetical protein BCR44DRAFT_32195 [Catenaria anguillulae PL171]|uniref:Uncharacterized protein n=1 Tax=Catenaria anguillulae PL171 TaxID=765915 RepID=A0A1Y2HIK1_9FUNG|nr:hypothetical protein BCR44DRAFT_32195 [Catenaria anguillulae PL171]
MDASPSHLDLRRLLFLGSSSSSSGRRSGHGAHLGLVHGPAHQWTDYLLATALAAGALAVGVVATRAARKFLSTSTCSSSSSLSSTSSTDGSHATSSTSTSLVLPTDRPVRVSITLRNTALWSPSSDPSMPNFAFIEGAKSTLVRHLAANPRIDLHVIAVVTSPEERTEVVRLLGAAGIYAYLPMTNVHLVDPWKAVVEETTSGELAGMPRHLVAQVLAVQQIRPDVHIEGSRSTRAVRWIAQHVPAVVWVHPRMARAASVHVPTTSSSAPRLGLSRGAAATLNNKHASPAAMSQGDSAVDVGLSSPSALSPTSYSVSTTTVGGACDDGLPPPVHADLSPAAAGDAPHVHHDRAALTPGALLFAEGGAAAPPMPTSPSAASGALASAEWSSSSSSSGTTTGTAAAMGETGGVGVVPMNVLVTERLADWTRRDSVLGGKVVEYGLA